MIKKAWQKPELKTLTAGSAESKGGLRDDSAGTGKSKS